MLPNLVLFGKVISPYIIAALAGVLLTVLYIPHLGKREKLDEFRILTMLLLAFGFGLIGAHLLYGVVEHETLFQVLRELDKIDSPEAFFSQLSRAFGGAVYYGGILTAILVGYFYLRRTEKDRAPYHDIGAVSIPLFHAFGRIGCFLSGCCYGVPWKYGLTCRHSLIESANGVPRFPVQLAEALANALLFLVLRRLFLRKKCQGRLMNLYLIAYPVCRFGLEYLRGDAYRGFVGPFSTSQFISLLLIVFSGLSLLVKHLKGRKSEASNE